MKREAKARRRTAKAIWFALIFLPWICGAVIIDRIAVVVGNQVITESEMDQEIRLTAFLNNEPVKITPETKRQAADRLIEQKLVSRELVWSRYNVPSEAQVKPMLESLIKDRFHGSEAELRSALEKYGITEQDLKDYLLWRVTLLRFIDFRFRPGILVTDQEIQEYYNDTILPLEKAAHPGRQVPTLEDMRGRIEQVLTERRIDQQLDDWLKRARERAAIEFREGAFQ